MQFVYKGTIAGVMAAFVATTKLLQIALRLYMHVIGNF